MKGLETRKRALVDRRRRELIKIIYKEGSEDWIYSMWFKFIICYKKRDVNISVIIQATDNYSFNDFLNSIDNIGL